VARREWSSKNKLKMGCLANSISRLESCVVHLNKHIGSLVKTQVFPHETMQVNCVILIMGGSLIMGRILDNGLF
jgi:hypothetical protein